MILASKPQSNSPSSNVLRWPLIAAILLVAAYLRFTGLNWDEREWIHPDEGHMRMITSAIQVPDSLDLYFDTDNSPLNSRNSGYVYSYGTLPLFATRLTAEWLDDHVCGDPSAALSARLAARLTGVRDGSCNPGTFTGARSAEVGRALSGLADLGTLVLIYLIGRRLYGESAGLLSMGLGALTAFSIQQAHFYTVDSMACFFVTLTAHFALRAAGYNGTGGRSWIDFGLAGLAVGLASACKVSAAFAAGLVALAGGAWWLSAIRANPRRSPLSALLAVLPRLVLAALLSLVAFRIAQPYAFEGPGFFGLRPDSEWFDRLGQIQAEQSGEIDYPSGRQWANRAPILFPWLNMVVWGMGLPLGLAAWAGWAVAGIELLRGKRRHLVLWVWASAMFLYQATQWVKAMRYFLPLYPLFAIFAAYGLARLCRAPTRRWRRVGYGLTAIVVAGAAVWAAAVFSVYLRPHPRLAASRWIYDNVPLGATLANEHWDWGLPLRVDGHDPFGSMYKGLEMQHYNEDTPEKLAQLLDWLDQADFIFLASNRLYASIPRLPERYPLTIAYYRALFAGELGFELLADFTSRPAIGPLQFPDQENPFPLMEAAYVAQREPIRVPLPRAEESFSVYDHPRALIFRKAPTYSRQLAEQVLGGINLARAEHGQKPREATSNLYLWAHDLRIYIGLTFLSALGLIAYRARDLIL